MRSQTYLLTTEKRTAAVPSTMRVQNAGGLPSKSNNGRAGTALLWTRQALLKRIRPRRHRRHLRRRRPQQGIRNHRLILQIGAWCSKVPCRSLELTPLPWPELRAPP